MSKLFIFILSLVVLFSVASYQFIFAKENKIVNFTCRDTVASFCQVNPCDDCELKGKEKPEWCTLAIDPDNYFNRAGSCSFTEKSQCEWKKTWRTDFCEQIRIIDSDIKIKLKINKRNFGNFANFRKTYFGNEAKDDFNGDGREDVVYLFTEDGGGSGTFYYVTVKLADGKGFKELNSVLLGDRIAPQTTEFREGMIVVNYADRKPSEPMTAKPSVGVSAYFKVVGNKLVKWP